MFINIKPTWWSAEYAKSLGVTLISGTIMIVIGRITTADVNTGEDHGKLRVVVNGICDETYIVPLWFRTYCKLFPILKFLPYRISWEIELPDYE